MELIGTDLSAQRKTELLQYVQSFYRRSWDWRSAKFHEKWNQNDRDYHSIYDPARAAQKEDWQEKIHTGMIVQNVEVIHSQIYKTMMAPKPPIQTQAGPAGDELQARLIQDIVAYQMSRAQFDVNFYDASKEAVKYGDGFIKVFWEKVEDTRRRRVAVDQSPMDVVESMPPQSLIGETPPPAPALQGFDFRPVKVLIRDSLAARYVHIRDVFPEPNTTRWDKLIHRDKISYGEIVSNINAGAFFDVKSELENVTEGEHFEADLSTIKQELGYFEESRKLSKFEKKHTIWELWCPIPRKWIQFDMPEGDDAETLVPAKVMVASGTALLASEENDKFDGECPILKIPYIRTGESYDMGVCDLLADDQQLANETVSQRVDNINLILNKGLAIIEAALVNAKQDLVSKPGWVLRIKAQWDDVRKAVQPIDFPDVTASAYRETLEIERRSQEKTGAGRVTLGSSDVVKDSNQTLGGMELLRQMFNERIAAYGMVIESAFLMKFAEKTYGLIYQRFGMDPEALKPILGDDLIQIGELPPMAPGLPPEPHMVPRYLAFAFPPPELVNTSYFFKPMGIFSMENKIVKGAQIENMIKLNIGNPSFDVTAASKYLAITVQGIDEAEKWWRPVPMIPLAMIPPELLPMIMEGQGAPKTNKKDMPGMKGGPNGNGAPFAPPNPVRREPVVQ